jgi:hypothetical protein
MKKFALMLALVFVATLSLAANTSNTSKVTLGNHSKIALTLTVDGEKGCTANPGQECTVIVKAGIHDFAAVDTKTGEIGPQSTRDIPAGSDPTWVICPDTDLDTDGYCK